MAIRLSGLSSGIDTDAVVEQLMSAHGLKKTKVVNKQTKLTWTQDKWKELNKKIYALYTEQLSKMRLTGSYQTKSITSSNEGKVTATATSGASTGSHSIEISQLASSQYITGGQLKGGVTGKTTLESLGFNQNGTNNIITITGPSDKKVEVTVTSKTTVDDFVDACKSAGLNASFDEKQQRLFINTKESGKEQQFTIKTSSIANSFFTSEENIKTSVNYAEMGLEDKEKVEQALTLLQKASQEDIDNIKTGNLDGITDKALVTAFEELCKYAGETTEKKYVSEIIKEVQTNIGTEEAYIKNILKDDIVADNATMSEEDLEKAVSEAYQELQGNEEELAKYREQYQLQKDTEYARLYSESDLQELKANAVTTIQTNACEYAKSSTITDTVPGGESVLSKLGLGEIYISEGKVMSSGSASGMYLIGACDAEFTLDGAKLNSSSNTVTVNDVTYTLKGVTDTAETVGIVNNTQAVSDMVKGFIKEYNNVLNEMNTLYYADSAKGYDPLTDEEKSTMSESQIELWESKIKDSLLRRDTTLGSVITSMKSALNKPVTVDGKQYSLSYFGICTSTDYSERGLLHIYGDMDDSVYANQDDKLMQAIENDPELVANVLSKMATNLYDTMTDKMKSTSLSSALTFYNDKQMVKQQQQYTKDITKLETRLAALETKYYNQFTAMEKAMSTLNSQSSYLSGLFSS